MKKRIMSLLLAMALALGLAAPAWAQSKYMIKDMPDTSLVLSPGQELEAARRLEAAVVVIRRPPEPGKACTLPQLLELLGGE